MFSLPVVTWIGNAAAVLSGRWGAVSQCAREVECSREAMYQQARRVEQAVAGEQASGPSREELLAENQRLRDDNRTLWALLDEAESLSEALQQQFVATASAMGLSLTQIVRLFAIVLSTRYVPSRATVGRWVAQSSCRAGSILAVLDRACQAWVLTLCLDEIFFHREPVLVAVEPDSMAWVAGQRGPDRTGVTWCALLQQWPGLERVVSDAGTGLARGVTLLNEARVAAATEPVQVGLDVFHTEREMQRVVGRRWARAEKLLEAAAQAEQQVEDAKRRGIDARGAAARARAAWSKARRLLHDARTLNHLDWMHDQRAQAVPDPLLRKAVVHLWYWRRSLGHAHGTCQALAAQMVIVERLLCQRLSPAWPQAYARVGHILPHTNC